MDILVQPFLKVKDTVIKLDKLYYDLDVADNWYNRYLDKATVIIAKENNEVLGYLLYCYITETLYNALKNEVLIGDYSINPKQYLKDGESDIIYLASIVSKNKKASLCLLKKFRETVK